MEVLQYKPAELFTTTDVKVLLNMLQEKMEITRAESRARIFAGQDGSLTTCSRACSFPANETPQGGFPLSPGDYA